MNQQHKEVQIESVEKGDQVRFNDASRPSTIVDVIERKGEKELTIKGERTGKYTLLLHRETGIIDFKRISKNKRRILLNKFMVVNREPRPFNKSNIETGSSSFPIDAETGYKILSLYRQSFIYNKNGEPIKLTEENREIYRNTTVLCYQIGGSKSTFNLVGVEIEILIQAIEWAIKNVEFNHKEEKQLQRIKTEALKTTNTMSKTTPDKTKNKPL